jgi:CRP-like cAMP-binding protein
MDILRKAALFDGMARPAVETVLRTSQEMKRADRAFFFLEGDPAERVFVLAAGKVKLSQVTESGQQVILGYLSPGRVYGIVALLEDATYPVSAQAVGSCVARFWTHEALHRLMVDFPQITTNAMLIMAGQIRQFQSIVTDLATRRVEQRIARAILRLARQSGRKTEAGILIDLPLSRQDLAEMTGTTLYTVSRVLTEWEKQNIARSKRRQIIITNPHGLVTIAEDLPTGEQPAVWVDGGT